VPLSNSGCRVIPDGTTTWAGLEGTTLFGAIAQRSPEQETFGNLSIGLSLHETSKTKTRMSCLWEND
jgi:hypothetical protein